MESRQFSASTIGISGIPHDSQALQAAKSKDDALIDAHAPQNVQKLPISWVVELLPKVDPSNIHALLHNVYKWKWSEECMHAFNLAKEKLVSSDVLVCFYCM